MKTQFLFCAHCDVEREEAQTSVVARPETVTVKEADVEVEAQVRVCNVCRHDIFDETLDFATQDAAFKKYRAHHGLVGPDEIRALRKKYHLSQRDMAALLGVGAATIARYELGSIPEAAQSNLISLLEEPRNVKKLMSRAGSRLSAPGFAKLEEAIRQQEAPCGKLVSIECVGEAKFPEAVKTGLPYGTVKTRGTNTYFDGRNHDEVDWMPTWKKAA